MIVGGPTASDCIKCALSKNRMKIVHGAGSRKSRIILVGEAPGEQEDLTGIPFIGRAGKFLDSALSENGLTRNDVFITNVVRCRPPGNRKPKDEEIEECLPHLIEELESIRPKVALAMGAVATKALTGNDERLSDIVGRKIEICCDDIIVTVIPCYHPSAAMRNQRLSDLFESVLADAISLSRRT